MKAQENQDLWNDQTDPINYNSQYGQYDPGLQAPEYTDNPDGRPGIPDRKDGIDHTRPGHWVGNQWVYDDIPITDVNGNPVNPPKDPNTPTTTPPDTNTPPATTTPAAPASVLDAFVPSNTGNGTYQGDTINTVVDDTGGGGGGSAGTSGGTSTSTTTTGPANLAPTTAPVSPYAEALRAQLLRLLNGPTAEQVGEQAGQSVPVNAFRNSMMRDFDLNRAQAAEESGLNGTQGSGGFEGRVAGLRQAAGEATAKYAGDYAHQAMVDRRAELQTAMDTAQKAGDTEAQRWLDMELAKMDVQIRQEQNANTRYTTEIQKLLGMSDVELRRYLGQLQDSTSRYGIDTGRANVLDQIGLGLTEEAGRKYRYDTDQELNPK